MANHFHPATPLLLVVLSIGLASCAASGGSMSEITADIPETAFEIHLYSDLSPEDYMGTIRRQLEMQGFDVVRYSAVDQNMATAANNIGRQLTLTIYVTVTTDGDVNQTRAVFSGIQGRPGVDDEIILVGPARWTTTGDNQSYAFARLSQFVNRIDHANLVYAIE